MRMHGETSRYHHKFVGGNFRLDALQAAILHVKLPHLDGWAEARRKNAEEIGRRYLEAGGLPFEKGGVKFPREAAGRHHVFNQFVVRVGGGRRDSLKDLLAAKGVGCAIYYPVPLHLQECFSSLGHKSGDFPESERAAKETLALPGLPRAHLRAEGLPRLHARGVLAGLRREERERERRDFLRRFRARGATW